MTALARFATIAVCFAFPKVCVGQDHARLPQRVIGETKFEGFAVESVQVFIDGDSVGTTDETGWLAFSLLNGFYDVVLRSPRFGERAASINVRLGGVVRFEYDFVGGELDQQWVSTDNPKVIITDEGGTRDPIFVDGVRLGTTNDTLVIPPGTYTFMVRDRNSVLCRWTERVSYEDEPCWVCNVNVRVHRECS